MLYDENQSRLLCNAYNFMKENTFHTYWSVYINYTAFAIRFVPNLYGAAYYDFHSHVAYLMTHRNSQYLNKSMQCVGCIVQELHVLAPETLK